MHTLAPEGDVAYGTWAAGDDYKASFDGGMTFVPYGEHGGQAAAVAWRTVSVRVGEHELVHGAPRRSTQSRRVEFAFGGVVEAYDVRAEGLEQTFVLQERPAAVGDLVVSGAISSTLLPTVRDRGIAFRDARGVERVHYGAATAIDARGRQWAMTTTLVGAGLELRLGAAQLAAAEFPLVVDPLIVPVNVTTGSVLESVAIFHDDLGTKGVWIAESRYAGGDGDLRLYRADNDGGAPVLVFSDITASWESMEPSLGSHRGLGKTVLAFTRHIVTGDTRRVRAHLHGRNDMAFEGTVVFPPAPGGRNQWRPKVGTERSALAPFSVLVVHQVEDIGAFANVATSAIHAFDLDCTGTGSVTAQSIVAEAFGVDCERPTIAAANGNANRVWYVGYQRMTNGPGATWDIGLRSIDSALIADVEQVVDSGFAGNHELAPVLVGSGTRMMLFYTQSTIAESSPKPPNANGHRIRGSRLSRIGSSWVQPFGTNLLQSNGDPRLEIGGADYDRSTQSHWALTFRSNATETIYVRTYGYQGEELTSNAVDSPASGTGLAVAGGVAYQADDHEFLVGYGIYEPGVNTYVRLARKTWPTPGPVTNVGSACTTTQLGWSGVQLIGSELEGLLFGGAPAGSITVAIVATQTASLQLFGVPPVADGCWLLVPLAGPDYLGLLPPIAAQNGGWGLPLPEGLDSSTLYFQAVSLEAGGTFRTSARLHVPIVK
ncbi:MAG: hypothetical protein JNK15_22690 [Planctomycetes bacterium]|nr:hypothetical protein [Planctomycetota bacterium]